MQVKGEQAQNPKMEAKKCFICDCISLFEWRRWRIRRWKI